MSENMPFIWWKNYRSEFVLSEKVLEHTHETARQYLRRAVEINKSGRGTRWCSQLETDARSYQ
ncbi:MAG TPA: hypothetical protein VKG24_13920 [Pseudolabrys sp.]|nr:hypothetical protein [Pseudolabrys sp.]